MFAIVQTPALDKKKNKQIKNKSKLNRLYTIIKRKYIQDNITFLVVFTFIYTHKNTNKFVLLRLQLILQGTCFTDSNLSNVDKPCFVFQSQTYFYMENV